MRKGIKGLNQLPFLAESEFEAKMISRISTLYMTEEHSGIGFNQAIHVLCQYFEKL